MSPKKRCVTRCTLRVNVMTGEGGKVPIACDTCGVVWNIYVELDKNWRDFNHHRPPILRPGGG